MLMIRGRSYGRMGKKRAAVAPPAGGGALLVGEANGWATDFLYATDASRVALKASSALTYYPVDGFYQNAGTSPKMVYDVAGVLGWSPHNLLPQSNDFTIGWAASGTAIAKNAIGPSGGANTAFTVTVTAGASAKNLTLDPGTTIGFRFSLYAKAGTVSWIALGNGIDPTAKGAYFNLAAGTVGTVTGDASNATIEAVGNGWYRCSVRLDSYTYLGISPQTADNQSWTWTATGTETIFIAQGQQNKGSVTLPYLPTTTATRVGLALDYDPVSHAARGLLCEPQATNLLTYSDDYSNTAWVSLYDGAAKVGPAGVTDPFGGSNAYELYLGNIGGAFASASCIYQGGITVVSGTAYTLSFYLRAKSGTTTVRIGIETGSSDITLTTAWQRFLITETASVATVYPSVRVNVAGNSANIYASHAQLESGSVATSVIPTTAATVTRAANAYKVASASINYSATAGSFWVDVNLLSYTSPYAIIIGHTSAGSPIYMASPTSFDLYGDGPGITKTVPNALGLHKVAAAFASGDQALTADGLTPGTDATPGTFLLTPGADISFGSYPESSTPIHGYIRKVRYVPRRKTGAEMQTETT